MPVERNEPRGIHHSQTPSRRKKPPPKHLIVGPETAFTAKLAHLKPSQTIDTRTRPAAGQATPPKPQANPEVISRQRTLRAAGYRIAVDGIWGPQSQAAWSAYTNQHRTVRTAFHAPSQPARVSHVHAQQRHVQAAVKNARGQAAKAQQRTRQATFKLRANLANEAHLASARSVLATIHGAPPRSLGIERRIQVATIQAKARLERGVRLGGPSAPVTPSAAAQEVARAAKFAAKARSKPPAEMTPAELVATTVDPLTGTFKPDKPAEVRRVQLWLKAHGRPSIKVDGQYGPETNAALLDAFTSYQRAEHHAQVSKLTRAFYDSHLVAPGKPIGPLAAAPKPAEMLSLLQKGGFTADLVWKALQQRAETDPTGWVTFQEHQLDGIEARLAGAFDKPAFLKGDLRQRAQQLAIGAGFAAGRGEMTDQEAARFNDEIGALVNARNATDLKSKLQRIKITSDQAIQRAQQAALGEKDKVHGFWGQTLHAFGMLGEPAHKLVTGGERLGADVAYVYHHPSALAELTRSKQENAALDQAAADFQARHPWVEFGLETTFDPLWLIDPVAVGGHLVEAGTDAAYRLEKLGIVLQDGGRIATTTAPLFSIPADTIRSMQLAAQGVGHFARGESALGGLLQLDHAYTVGRKLVTTKQETIAAATRRVRVLRRNGFKNFGTDLFGGNPVTGRLRYDIDHSAPQLRAKLDQLAPQLADTLADNLVSIFVDEGRVNDSVIGGQIRARMTRAAELMLHQHLAFDEAHIAYVVEKYGSEQLGRELRAAGMSGQRFEAIATKRITPTADEQATFNRIAEDVGLGRPVRTDEEAALVAQQTLKDVLAKVNNSLFGGIDKDIEQLLRPRMDAASQDIADTLAEIQTMTEERLAARKAAAAEPTTAHDLFHPKGHDNAGRWVGEGGTLSRQALKVAASAFDNTIDVANAAFDKPHTADEMWMIRNREIERYTNSLRYTAGRKAGEGLFTNEIPARVQERLDALNAAWEKRADGFYDTRRTIPVPTFLATHLRDAYAHAPAELLDSLPAGARDVVNSTAVIAPSQLDRSLDLLAFAVARGRSLSHFDRQLLPGLDTYLIRDIPFGSHDWQLASEYLDVLRNHTALLDRAAAWAQPRELLRDYAIWAALAKAQTAPLRVLYKSLLAFLDVWLVATLPLRPGFAVRNIIDNTAKMLADGAIDPRYYFISAAEDFRSVFTAGIDVMQEILSLGGHLQHNPALYYFNRLVDTFWAHDTSIVKRIFAAHNIDVPESAIDKMRFTLDDGTDPGAIAAVREARNKLMHLMANFPENNAKRILYRDTYRKALARGASDSEAHDAALARIDRVLFDYSKVSTLEDNLRFIFPFVQFWRKTLTFWTATAVKTPGLPVAIDRFEHTLQDKQNADLPSWMRRYVNISPVTHALNRIPGLGWLLPGLQDGLQADPLQFFSFNVLYRAFTNSNPGLPADQKGLAFIAPFVDALNDWGLSMNPLVRKPAEFAGVFNYRAWQSVFPETGVIDAISRRFLTDDPAGFNLEAWIEDETLNTIGFDLGAKARIEQGFEQYVQLEMAARAKRGEPVDRAAAVKKIQRYYVIQTTLLFFAGMAARRRDTSDIYLYNLQEQMLSDSTAFAQLSPADQHAYRMFAKRKLDPAAYDHYLQTLPQIEAYYSLHSDYGKAEAFKHAHPEILSYVSKGWRHPNLFSDTFVKDLPLIYDTGTAMNLLNLATAIKLNHTSRAYAERTLVTPALQAFWNQNDTPRQRRDKMLQGQLHHFISRLQNAYFAIPATDYDARNGFLQQNPILAHYWTLNDSNSDDLKGILNAANATLRDRYFEYLDDNDHAGAAALLRRFPFIFEFTKAADRITPDGDWIGSKGRGGGTEHSRDYLAAKTSLDAYFALPEAKRSAWLHGDTAAARTVRAYFAKWAHQGPLSEHAKDYLAAKDALATYFSLLKTGKGKAYAWLDGHTAAAKQVRAYFRKWAAKNGMSQHAHDYLDAKDGLARYFALQKTDKTAASAWLHSGGKAANTVLAYFKKYGRMNTAARNWTSADLTSSDPELNARLGFWQAYWGLDPASRPAFVARYAADDGVFVYGTVWTRQRADAKNDYLRQALAHGQTRAAALYKQLKPLVDLYYTLDNPSDQDLFLRANPDIQHYLDLTANQVSTGDKDLDRKIAAYFKLDRGSEARSTLLHNNPDLQAYFDAHSSPADVAIRKMLDVYFAFTDRRKQAAYSAQHPEIQAYFDKRNQERTNEMNQAIAFDLADPRLRELLDHAWHAAGLPAQRMLESLRSNVAKNRFGDTLTRRTERQPLQE